MRLHVRPLTRSLWNARQAVPISTSNLRIVPFAAPVILDVARMEFPSQSAERTRTLCSTVNLFMDSNMPTRSSMRKREIVTKLPVTTAMVRAAYEALEEYGYELDPALWDWQVRAMLVAALSKVPR